MSSFFLAKPGVSEQDAELARLKKENALLRMERAILKKAAGYFAKESL
jgi:transposase